MKILVAPNAMKGSLSAIDFANVIEEGLKRSGVQDIDKIPIADGGDGTGSILACVLHADFISCRTVDPLGRELQSGFYLNNENVAIVEMAAASGLHLLEKSEYSALNASSYGTGQLIRSAVEHGAKTILFGVGGSATVDAGMGALMALGVRFYNKGQLIENGCGAQLGNVTYMETDQADELMKNIRLVVLSDVTIPMLGQRGAVALFASQKGANQSQLSQLSRNLSLFAGALFQQSGRSVDFIPHGGAAGGIAASFNALFNAELVNGASYILNMSGFYSAAQLADVIITGEGKLDNSTLTGKAPGAVVQFGTDIDKPVYAICGMNDLKGTNLFREIISLTDNNISLKMAMNNSYSMVVAIAEKLGVKLIDIYDK